MYPADYDAGYLLGLHLRPEGQVTNEQFHRLESDLPEVVQPWNPAHCHWVLVVFMPHPFASV